jgi:dimethylglycine dehydrogenase
MSIQHPGRKNMKEHTRVLIIGGGIVGCSVLYHLTKLGWKDVTLLERDELTSGSTWLAAGNVPQFSLSRVISRLVRYSIDLYQGLEKETGQSTGWHTTGSLRLATHQGRMDEFKRAFSKDRMLGIDSELVDINRILELFPLINKDGIIGGLFHPHDGHVDANGVTQAFAKGARNGGAEIYRFTRAMSIQRTASDDWIVETDKGVIKCEYLVLAPGPWASQVAAMVGFELPVVSVEHHHVLFDEIPELKGLSKELPVLRDPDIPFYLRQEINSLLIGPYEKQPKAWKPNGIAWNAKTSIAPDLERLQDNMMRVIERVPILTNVGIKQVVNGPITYAPDGVPLVGPIYGSPNLFVLAAINFGITLAGGFGKHMAHWIVDNDPGIDLSALDPRRFGTWVTKRYALVKALEAYRMGWQTAYPEKERPAARPLRTAPIYDRQLKNGAVFGSRYGWERPAWFEPQGPKKEERLGFYRATHYFPFVQTECRAARDRVAVYEMNSLSKYEIAGPGAKSFLNHLTTNLIPEPGRVAFTLMVSPKGKMQSDFVIAGLDRDRYYLVGAATAEYKNLQWMESNLPEDGSASIKNVTRDFGVLTVIGPKSRELLARLTEEDIAPNNFPHFAFRNIELDFTPAMALRVNYAGELGWELHHPMEFQRALYDAVMAAGDELGVANIGMLAYNSLRLEKGYCGAAELSGENTPLEAGLERFVKFDKGDFIGRSALLVDQKRGAPQNKLVLLQVDAEEADALGDEPVLKEGKVVGRVTSGGYGHRVEKSLALAYIAPEYARPGSEVSVEILNKPCEARVVSSPLYDPGNMRLRG